MNRFHNFIINRIVNDKCGLAAVEFAMLAPFLIAILAGLGQVASTININMSARTAAFTISDLISRCASVNSSDISEAFIASALILNSSKTMSNNFAAFVASVTFDQNTASPTIAWRSNIGSPASTNATILSNVTGKAQAGDSLIASGVEYYYAISSNQRGVLAFTTTSYSSPRLTSSVTNGSIACDWTVK